MADNDTLPAPLPNALNLTPIPRPQTDPFPTIRSYLVATPMPTPTPAPTPGPAPGASVSVAQPSRFNPTRLVVFLYLSQFRLEEIRQRTDAIRLQIATMRGLRREHRDQDGTVATLDSAIQSNERELAAMVRSRVTFSTWRDSLSDVLRLSRTPLGLDETCRNILRAGGYPSSAQLAQVVQQRLGISAPEAAAQLGIASPSYGESHSIVRAHRLIIRLRAQSTVDPQRARPAEMWQPWRGDRRDGSGPSGGCSGLPGAMAYTVEYPDSVQSVNDAYAASWETQARLFATGIPMASNVNRKRTLFSDGSYVDIQSHEPGLTYTDDSNALATTLLLYTGIVPGAVYLAARPFDAAWNGYTAYYYNADNSATPWKTAEFYGWARSDLPVSGVSATGITDPSHFENFAEQPQNYSWWGWKETPAPERPFRFEAPDSNQLLEEHDAQLLIQAMAAFKAEGGMGTQTQIERPPRLDVLSIAGQTPQNQPNIELIV